MHLEFAKLPTLQNVYREVIETEDLAHLEERLESKTEDMVLLKEKCDRGNIDALRIMAVRLMETNKHTEQALDILTDLLKAQDAKATFMMGYGYILNPEEAELGLKLTLRAIDLGATPQMFYVAGICFRDGIGTQEDAEESAKYLKEAADQDYNLACDLYGHYLITGYGVEKNAKSGFDIIEAAAHRHSVVAMNSLGVLCQKGEIYPPASGYDAYYWYEKAAEFGDVLAALNLGKLLIIGNLVEAEPEKAYKYFKKAATAGHPEAAYNLGLCYLNGEGVEENKRIANDWFLKAAKKGHPGSLFNIGVSYLNGIGYSQDMIKAFQFAVLAAAQGYSPDLLEALNEQVKGRKRRKGLKLASNFATEHRLKTLQMI